MYAPLEKKAEKVDGGREIQQESKFMFSDAYEKDLSYNQCIQKAEGDIKAPNRSSKANNTGIPDKLKERFEYLSGFSLDDVKVHYNSEKPERLQALAYTQGNQVYVGPGQEKHLQHELGHVLQQKAGLVRPTEYANGNYMNKDAALERNAGQYEHCAYRGPHISSYVENSVIQLKEDDSVFDMEKLRQLVKTLLKRQKGEPGWPSEMLNDNEIEAYAERIQSLFEDIRQVDLRFLAATSMAFQEDTEEGTLTDENKLTEGEAKQFNKKELEEQQKYKIIVYEKLQYLEYIEDKLKKDIIKIRRKKGDKTVLAARKKYLFDVQEQLSILRRVMNQSRKGYKLGGIARNEFINSKGYVFNQNSLLIDTDNKINFYMTIVGPSLSGAYKDIVQRGGKMVTKGTQLQLGMATPVRAFSWYTKYLMDPSALANTPPVIRTIGVPANQRKKISMFQSGALSESHSPEDKDKPMNEDFKVPDQYGVKVDSTFLGPFNKSKVTSYVESDLMPDGMLENSGAVLDMAAFKNKIGFSRSRNNKTTITDIHFFDRKHTAFHEISDDGKVTLYSPQKAAQVLNEFGGLMDTLIMIYGKQKIIKNMVRKGLLEQTNLNENHIEQLIELLEANHCLPPKAIHNLHGNPLDVLEKEQQFALSHIRLAQNGQTIDGLLNLTVERYQARLSELQRGADKKKCALEIYTPYNKLLDSIIDNGGLHHEFELLRSMHIKVSIGALYSKEGVVDLFNTLKEHRNRLEASIHIIALCFKLLRLIKQDAPSESLPNNIKKIEESLFSRRVSGDYFGALNKPPVKEVDFQGKKVVIPYDKLTSTRRFFPAAGRPKIEYIPFVGGTSGTTRDISADLLNKKHLQDEKEYWQFQLLNASFMIIYDYHSFFEVIWKAAVTRKAYFSNEPISNKIIKYAQEIKNFFNESDLNLIDDIQNIIEGKSVEEILRNYQR